MADIYFKTIGNKSGRPRIFSIARQHKPGGLVRVDPQTEERPIMKRFFVLCTVLSLATAFAAGCDMNKKKSEVKDTTTITTPEGAATVTDTQKVETSGDNPPATTK
ncbi:MAG TPA: hypothetical protein VMR25_18840 [Planctomycetaceae bacterium]|nr:hypothetical protein [Planctomycetaceae bacterium]